MTVSYVDRQTFAFLGDTVTKALGLTETEYGWLTSAFSIAYLFAVPVSGWWLDRAGARRGLAISVLLWSSIAALHALVLRVPHAVRAAHRARARRGAELLGRRADDVPRAA